MWIYVHGAWVYVFIWHAVIACPDSPVYSNVSAYMLHSFIFYGDTYIFWRPHRTHSASASYKLGKWLVSFTSKNLISLNLWRWLFCYIIWLRLLFRGYCCWQAHVVIVTWANKELGGWWWQWWQWWRWRCSHILFLSAFACFHFC